MAETAKSKENSNVKNLEVKETLKSSILRKCFTAIVDRKQVDLDIKELHRILKDELFIPVETLQERLVSVLPFMLVFYIKSWPGWQKSKEYYSGKLNFREWFDKFRQYVVVKINYIIKNGYQEALQAVTREWKHESRPQKFAKDFRDQGAQTDYLNPKIFAPFSISIEGPPTLLGTINWKTSKGRFMKV